MKIDRTRLRKSSSEIPPECQALIDRLCVCSRTELLDELRKINTWTFGKCELYHWTSVLDNFDMILEEAATPAIENKWALYCDTNYNNTEKKLLLWTLHFTTLLIEHSFSRHLYNSMEHLLTLLTSSDMSVVLGVLNLLYMFSKRSNFITRLPTEKRSSLISRLQHLAESWGGKENGFGLADCCNFEKSIPPWATTLHFEFHKDQAAGGKDSRSKNNMEYIHIANLDKLHKTPAEIMKGLLSVYTVPPDKEMLLFTHVRLAHHFADYRNRLLCVLARLQALSVLVYSNALQDSAHTLLYNGLLEELVELIELKLPYLVEIRSAALRTLTSIIHLDRNPHFPKKPGSRLNSIIDVTGANQYHGFLPVLVRNCIASLTKQTSSSRSKQSEESESIDLLQESDEAEQSDSDDENVESDKYMDLLSDVGVSSQIVNDSKKEFPLPLATALFSFLYHLASYEAGGDALVSCGMMESLLQVINWHGVELEHITFVTRAVRVIDLITNIDMQAFHTHGGLQSFINRLDIEVGLCRKEQVYEFQPNTSDTSLERSGPSDAVPEEESLEFNLEFRFKPSNFGKTCLPQRAALLKSMLNFLKKALQDSTFSENIRHLMEGSLPSSLKHIISNAEYYGPSLFLLATDVVTVYVFQEPSLLSTLQDNGLTDVVLHALLIKDVPATREVLSSLPNVFSALCLNNRGLASFVKCKPFERLFKVLLSPAYLPAMRRRRSSDPLGDTASNLGSAMDELMRHQPSLKVDATAAIIKLLNELCQLGSDPKYVCWRPHSKLETSPSNTSRPTTNTEGSSDEEDDDEEEASTSSHNQAESQDQGGESEKTPIALVDYILNVMKFIDAILSNNSTDDHCREFVNQGGLVPLLKILGLPNLPVDCPVTTSSQAVASVCKSILNLAQEPKVLKQGLLQLGEVLQSLKPLYTRTTVPTGSKLLQELTSAPKLETAFSTASATPLLHAMGAAHGYVLMFVHVCRTGQNDIRTLSLQHWGSEEGLAVLKGLAELYTSLVWESTLLLALCSDDVIPSDCDFGREHMEKLNSAFAEKNTTTDSPGYVASAMEALTTSPPATMDVDVETTNAATATASSKPTPQQLTYIKPLLGASSRLGRALAELFGLLVKLCVGSPIRQRRGQNMISTPPLLTPYARNVATALNSLLANGLNSECLPPSPIPKFRLTFLICSVGFTSPMLFDEKRYPYHLMLQKFVSWGGQATFFSTFKWALSAGGTIPLEKGLEHPNLPDGTGEFLDVWLMLLEKMVNPKAILDSPHVITNKQNQGPYAFDPLKYLIQIHKLAFEAVMYMWGKKPLPNYGLRMTESILSILRHILRGEKIIKERLSKTTESKPETPVASSATTSSSGSTVYGESNSLRQLMDMGFSREHALEALVHTPNIEQATEYLLSNRDLVEQAAMEFEMSEDDQVMQAIAMSLGEAGPSEKEKKKEPVEDDAQPLTDELIDNFSVQALDVCLELIETIPECIYKVCDLLVTIMKRNGRTFRDNLLDRILVEIAYNARHIVMHLEGVEPSEALYQELLHSEKALRLGYYTHLYTLFFEVPSYFDMRVPCGFAVHRAKLIDDFIRLICIAEIVMTELNKPTEPKWLTPVLLLIDSLCKIATCTQRKRDMHQVTTRTWKWYDLVTGKWTPYSANNNKLINDAYWNGEQSIRVTCGRRRYTVTFSNMLQMNDESGNNRPISMTLHNLTKDYCTDITKQVPDEDEEPYVTLTEKEEKRCVPAPSMDELQLEAIVRSCVKFMHLQIDKDLLHAIMRVCVRLTRDFYNAKIFVQEGGVKCLLKMRPFSGYETLATVLIRHTLEEPQTLAYAMEKVLRARTLMSIPPAYKELIYLTRQIGGACTRSPETFYEVAKDILRIETSVFMRNDEVDTRLPLRCQPTTRVQGPPLEEEISIEVIYDLLNALLLPLEFSETESVTDTVATRSGPSTSRSSGSTRDSMYQRASDLLSTGGSDEILMDNQDTSSGPGGSRSDPNSTFTLKENTEQELAIKPLLGKHAIIKILADAVVSYGAIAKLITDFTYKAGTSDVIIEDCSALAFIFDKLLPITENLSDRDVSNMCRMLIAAIASCNHSADAQAALVSEVKAALIRALLMPESSDKHSQVQLICGIISTMIENCPPIQPRIKNQPQPAAVSGHMNNIVRLMLRKGIFNDLARVPHCMDLSSPNFPFTVNASLKPLESLSRIVNQPVNGTQTSKIKKTHQGNLDEAGGTQSGATSTEATNAQGEEAAEDTENTEHDVSAVASSLEVNPSNQTDDADADNLLDIMDQLLERTVNDGTTQGHNHAMDIDEDGNLGYDHERDATEELMSTDSGDSDSNASDQEVQDDDNDDNEADDEDIDEADDNEDNNSDEEENDSRAPNIDRDEDILMIQYADHETENDGLPLVRGNDTGFTIPIFDETSNSNDQSGSGPVTHPLLTFRHSSDNGTGSISRSQRVNRSRRYQYVQVNPRTPQNPPVILQRLLGPSAVQTTLGATQLFAPSSIHDTPRVLIMDNFSLFPSTEEHIDFVDQAGFLFGPTVAATINHITSLLYWWNEESKLLDVESTYDCTTYICNKLIPTLMMHRNAELIERKQKKMEEEKKSGKSKLKQEGVKGQFADAAANEIFADILPRDRSHTTSVQAIEENVNGEPAEGVQETTQSVNTEESGSVVADSENVNQQARSIPAVRLSNRAQHGQQQPESTIQPDDRENPNYSYEVDHFNFQDFPVVPRLRLEDQSTETGIIFSELPTPPPIDLEDEHETDEEVRSRVHYSSSFTNRLPLNAPVFGFSNSESQSLSQGETTSNYTSTTQTTTTSTSSQEGQSESSSSQPPASQEGRESADADADADADGTGDNADIAMSEPAGRSSERNDEIPEGVDPSFLEALPPDMRTEVLEQHRILRLQQRMSAGENPETAVASSSTEVSPEFLAALPPSLQEEVLTQQRLEQQRQAAARANPNEPVDAGAFFETLQPSLRTMILSDMEDSQMSVLPPDLAAEAQTLRRDWEARNRQIVQERFLQSNLTTIIRHSTRGRLGSRFSNFLPQRAQWNSFGGRDIMNPDSLGGNVRVRGRQLLDHESLSCLLVLLFADSPHLNKLRLHRVIRNLCYHGPTRDWIVRALLSIIDKSVHVKPDENQSRPPRKIPKPGPLTSKLVTDVRSLGNGANWLNIRMEAALGCHANVFIVNRATGKRSEKSNPSTVTIHHQAAPIVCRNALDLFISLSKSFPAFLLPLKLKEDKDDKSKASTAQTKTKGESTDFWDMLLKLDSTSAKKGKSLAKTHSNLSLCSETENVPLTFEQSAFGQLLCMLSSPIIYRNTQLTDNLLRLLSVITMGMPELSKTPSAQKTSRCKSQKLESVSAPESALSLAVNVLTYKSCSEEGLEYVTTLLLNLASCSLEMSYTILNLLLTGAMRIGEVVREQIQSMLDELRSLNKVQKRAPPPDEPSTSSSKGVLSNRFTKENVVITASTKVKTACDLQLPSMAPLTSKTSSQVFFLRVLRVIVQIREAIKKAIKKDEEEKSKKKETKQDPTDADNLSRETAADAETSAMQLSALSDQLLSLEFLWDTLSQCLLELEHTPDHHAVLVLQPAVEAFFLVHSPQQGSTQKAASTQESESGSASSSSSHTAVSRENHDTDTTSTSNSVPVSHVDLDHSGDSVQRSQVPQDHLKFLNFAEKHRTVLNQILRQTTAHLADGPFSVLVDHTRVLDFDVKRRYFRTELERLDQGIRREETAVHVRRSHIFEDSFRELYRRSPEEWKNRFYIVFEDEEGQDAGGLLREWYVIISRDIFNPMYALFTVSPGDRVTYMINSASHYNPNHLCYYKFVGRVIAKAIYDNKLLECYFTRSFYKHILGIPVKYTDMESEDYSFYRGLIYLMENNINNLGLDLTFSTEINEFGVTQVRDLIPNGRNVPVTEENKLEYVRLSCQMKMTGAIRQQLNAFLEGFYDIIPMRLISIFNEQELELLISGLPNVDIEDLRSNTEYHKYQANSLQIQWFWRALRSFDQADRAKFLQFVTGTSKVPLQGFGALEGMNGVQKFQIHRDDRSTDRLPSAHTCFNQLDLPVYETYDKLRSYLLKAIHECSEGFGFA